MGAAAAVRAVCPQLPKRPCDVIGLPSRADGDHAVAARQGVFPGSAKPGPVGRERGGVCDIARRLRERVLYLQGAGPAEREPRIRERAAAAPGFAERQHEPANLERIHQLVCTALLPLKKSHCDRRQALRACTRQAVTAEVESGKITSRSSLSPWAIIATTSCECGELALARSRPISSDRRAVVLSSKRVSKPFRV
jgi:hypothetical protein